MKSIVEQIRRGAKFLDRYPWLWMVLVAFALRLGLILVRQTYQFSPRLEHFGFGGETGSIARSVAEGEGFSSPFTGSTGPTAWIGPVYVYLCAAVFRIFGVFTHTSGIAMLSINSVFSALTSAIIYFIGVKTCDKTVGMVAGWSWAVIPTFMALCTTWVWETSLSALLLSVALLFAVDLCKDASWSKWTGFGVFWGFCALTNPALLSVFPISLAWIAFRLHREHLSYIKRVATAILLCIATISPWLIRNRIVFGQWVFIRSNFAFEFYLDNHEVPERGWWFADHPTDNPSEYQKYKNIGEIAYIELYRSQAISYVRQHPRRFLSKTADRFMNVWTAHVFSYIIRKSAPPRDLQAVALLPLLTFSGLALAAARKNRFSPYFAALILLYPLPYYITFPATRYRHPIEPVMLLMASYFVVEAIQVLRDSVLLVLNRSNLQREFGTMPKQETAGFSLIELLIVVAIVLLLASIAIPNFLRARISANEASAMSTIRSICTAQISYKIFNPDIGYAATLTTLGPSGAGLLDSQVGASPFQHNGYQYASTGDHDAFQVSSVPLQLGVSGNRSFCSNTPAAIYYSIDGNTCVIGTNPLN